MQAVLCIVHWNKVSKPVKGKYLLLCVNSIMYLLLTWYTLIIFSKVLSHLILKIKSFVKYFKKGVLKYFQIFIFLNISKWNISSCISKSTVFLDDYATHNFKGPCKLNTRGMKNWRFSTNISLYLENSTRYDHAYNERPLTADSFAVSCMGLGWVHIFR